MAKLYEYDIKRGHYYLIKEADGDGQTTTSNVTTDTDKTSTTSTSTSSTTSNTSTNKSIETNSDIQQINADLQAELKRYQSSKKSIEDSYNNNKQAQTDLLNAAMQAAGNSVTTSTTVYDPVQTNANVLSIRKKLLDMELKHAQDLSKVELEHATKVNAIENNRLTVLSKLNNEGWERVPAKYRKFINEGNMSDIKIYMNDLVANDERHIIKDINDMRTVFEKTGLPYGKDKRGYYTLCVDQADLTTLYETLIRTGYSKDEIYSNIYPQTIK